MKNTSSTLLKLGIIVAVAIALLFMLQNRESWRGAPGEVLEPLEPSEPESATYAINTTMDFARAIQAGDLSLFLKTTAQEFQDKFSVRQFEEAFGGFISQNINLMAVQNYQPTFVIPPGVNKDGDLVLRGYFPTRPSRIHFDYTYQWKAPEWKIVGVNIDVQPEK